MPTIGVYKITNTISGRYYIGYSTNIEKRFITHKSKLKTQTHDNIFMQRAYNCDGEDCFTFDIIHIYDTKEDAMEKELEYLSDLSIRSELYNLHYNNSGGDMLTHHPYKDDIVKRIRDAVLERNSKMTEEERKQRWSKCGEKNGMFGRTHT